MRALLAALALLLLGATAPTNSPSFSCAGMLTSTEAAICTDPELAAWDRAIALLFPIQRRNKGITAAGQKDWLAGRDRCGGDKACLRRRYQDWPGFPAPTGFGAQFDRPARYDEAGLEIVPIGEGWHAFSVQAIHVVFDRRGRILTANDGNIDAVVLIQNGRGHYSSDPGSEFSCEIDFTRTRSGWQLKNAGGCGGLNVVLAGQYFPHQPGKRM